MLNNYKLNEILSQLNKIIGTIFERSEKISTFNQPLVTSH